MCFCIILVFTKKQIFVNFKKEKGQEWVKASACAPRGFLAPGGPRGPPASPLKPIPLLLSFPLVLLRPLSPQG